MNRIIEIRNQPNIQCQLASLERNSVILVKKFLCFLQYVGEGARMVRELFEMARTKKACLIFFDEIDAVGGARFDDGAGGDNEVQRTMLELINQLDGFDPRGNIKVLMATNRPDTLGMLKVSQILKRRWIMY